jgi:hypothetical protein
MAEETKSRKGSSYEIKHDAKFKKMTRKVKLRSLADNLALFFYGYKLADIRGPMRITEFKGHHINVHMPPEDGSVDVEAAVWNDPTNLSSAQLIYQINRMVKKAKEKGLDINLLTT